MINIDHFYCELCGIERELEDARDANLLLQLGCSCRNLASELETAKTEAERARTEALEAERRIANTESQRDKYRMRLQRAKPLVATEKRVVECAVGAALAGSSRRSDRVATTTEARCYGKRKLRGVGRTSERDILNFKKDLILNLLESETIVPIADMLDLELVEYRRNRLQCGRRCPKNALKTRVV